MRASGSVSADRVYIVGPRYQHHCGHSGYEGFVARSSVAWLRAPVRSRFLAGRLGRFPVIGDLGHRLDQLATALTPRPLYTLGILLIELAAVWHMLTHRRSLYHVIYGDTDFWLLGYARRLTGNFLVASFHEPDYAMEWLRLDRIARRLDAAILVSESQRAYFKDVLPPERIFVVPHGVDTEFFRPAETLGREPICITVGAHHRDPVTFKRALDVIFRKCPDIRVKAVGARRQGGGNFILEDDRVEHLEGISDEDLRAAYQSATLAVFSFNQATANNALLEAMACGLPIVATDVGGVRDCVGEHAGILCRQWDYEELAAAVLRLVGDRELAVSMGASARARALGFDFEAVAGRFEQVYRSVLEERETAGVRR
jgi:glycosyltransferase involved in cell wall biosynthesis